MSERIVKFRHDEEGFVKTWNDFGELIRCKDCRYFELNHFDNINGIPIITAHEICTKWRGGCKTSQDGYCFMAERVEQ